MIPSARHAAPTRSAMPDRLRELRRAATRTSRAAGAPPPLVVPVRIGPWLLNVDEAGRLVAAHDDGGGAVTVLAEPPVDGEPAEKDEGGTG